MITRSIQAVCDQCQCSGPSVVGEDRPGLMKVIAAAGWFFNKEDQTILCGPCKEPPVAPSITGTPAAKRFDQEK